jgi:pimeloyl-ACP methyl ester carboxylesterase
MLWHEKGGSGKRLFLLLHGLSATSGVWGGVRRLIDQRGLGRWITVDLPGHGRSTARVDYSVGAMAADIASLVREEPDLFVMGHSLGAYIGLALSSHWFGIEVRGVLAIGPKVTWTASEVQSAHQLATRPVRWYTSAEEASKHYRRVSGLDEQIAAEEDWLCHAVTHCAEGWRLAQDPRTFQVVGAPFSSLIASAQSPAVFARGEHDKMVNESELRVYSRQVHQIAGAGHNAHVEKPAELLSLLQTINLDDRGRRV